MVGDSLRICQPPVLWRESLERLRQMVMRSTFVGPLSWLPTTACPCERWTLLLRSPHSYTSASGPPSLPSLPAFVNDPLFKWRHGVRVMSLRSVHYQSYLLFLLATAHAQTTVTANDCIQLSTEHLNMVIGSMRGLEKAMCCTELGILNPL